MTASAVFEAGAATSAAPEHWNRYPGARFRFGKLDLRLFIFEGADAGMGLEGSISPPSPTRYNT